MWSRSDVLRILLIDDDELMLNDAAGLEHERVVFTAARSTAEARLHQATAAFGAVIVSLDLPGGEDFVREQARRAHAPSLIAIAGRGGSKMTLEYKLLRAELRGARMALPKPIDAVELAIAAVNVCDCPNKTREDTVQLIADLERRIAY